MIMNEPCDLRREEGLTGMTAGRRLNVKFSLLPRMKK
jgi:hypothetical protein